jgi:hypothetical protein
MVAIVSPPGSAAPAADAFGATGSGGCAAQTHHGTCKAQREIHRDVRLKARRLDVNSVLRALVQSKIRPTLPGYGNQAGFSRGGTPDRGSDRP